MQEKLTWDEIKRRYADEYFVLAEMDHDERGIVTSGVVLSHASHPTAALDAYDRSVMYTAFLWTGETPGGVIAVFDDVDSAA